MTETTERLDITAAHREVLGHVLDKWSVLVLEELCESPRRFNQLRRLIPVTQKSLTATLRRLERSGIVERVVVSDRPVAVEYRITALGKTLRDPVDAILRWSDDHLAEIEQARARFDDATGGDADRRARPASADGPGDLDVRP
jgi:DNA-binding HxlR family transcriptional regulator